MNFKRWLQELFSTPHTNKVSRSRPDRTLLNVECLEARALLSAVVWTDEANYATGATAIFYGSGFAPGETLQFQVVHVDGKPDLDSSHQPFLVTDGSPQDLDSRANGKFKTTWFVSPDNADSTLMLTVTGLSSGATAAVVFTDGAVTPATGGEAISADTVSDTFTVLTGPAYTEAAPGEVSTGTIILNAPAGFIFDTTANPGIRITGGEEPGDNINGVTSGTFVAMTTVSATQLTFTVTSTSQNTGVPNTLTWENIEVRPTLGTPLASGNLLLDAAGTAVLVGVTKGTGGSNFGTLTEVAGAASQLFYTTPAQTLTVGQVSDTITIQIRDEFGNPVNAGVGGLTVDLDSGSPGGGTFFATDGTTVISTVTIPAGSSTASYKYQDDLAGTPLLLADAPPLEPGLQQITINKGLAGVTLSNLTQVFNGTPRTVTANTDATGTSTFTITYDGSSTAPTDAGSYDVVATLNNDNFEGSVSGTLEITKATANVTLSNLTQGFDGTPKVVTATTDATGTSTFTITYDGSTTAPSAIGSYDVIATLNNANFEGSASGTLVIGSAIATVTLSGLNQTFDGTPKSVTATTDATGTSTFVITYDGSTTPPTAVGSYDVVATLVNDNFQGAATGTLVIAASTTATVTLAGLNQTFDGSPKTVTASTDATGTSTFTITYDGSATAPTDAGTYAVVATLVNDNFQGSATGNLVIAKAAATVTLGNLSQTFDGSPKTATATTTATGTSTFTITYDGSATAPSAAGSYAVVATLNNTNFQGSATGTLTIVNDTASQLSFVQQPAGTLAGSFVGPIEIQLANSTGGPIAQAGVSITLWLSSGALVGTATTDATGKATFSSVSISLCGTYTLMATADGLTAAVSEAFVIAPNPLAILRRFR